MSQQLQISIIELSEFIVKKLNSHGEPISNKKLNKLLYYMQGWHYAYFGYNIYKNNQLPKAWVHGPVYTDVYHNFKAHGYGNIDLLDLSKGDDFVVVDDNLPISTEQKELLSQVLKVYGSKSSFELEQKTHHESPWIETRKGLQPHESSTKNITASLITEYFSSLKDKVNKK